MEMLGLRPRSESTRSAQSWDSRLRGSLYIVKGAAGASPTSDASPTSERAYEPCSSEFLSAIMNVAIAPRNSRRSAEGIGIEGRLVKCAIHQLHPAVARGLIDGKGHVTHAEARVAALFDVARRSAKAADKEIPQTQFRRREIVRRIHRSEDVVGRHPGVEGAHQSREPLFADAAVDLLCSQIHNASVCRMKHRRARTSSRWSACARRMRRKASPSGQ